MARRGKLLIDIGEHAWIARLLRRLGTDGAVLVGPGDDAAVVRALRRPIVLTVDALVEGTHFRRGWTSAASLGRRAFKVNASDLAAMGARPRVALLAVEAPARTSVADLDAVVGGVAAAARRVGATLVGGNLSAGPHLAITLALVGEAGARTVTRAGAKPGDLLYLTGTIGGAGLAVRALRAGRRAAWPEPPLRVGAGRLLATLADAMIDVSDGVVQDAEHLCRASGVAATLEADRLPIAPGCRAALGARAAAFAATAGEDYELLAAVPPARSRVLDRLRPRLGCRLTRVGRIVAGVPVVRLLDRVEGPVVLRRGGFDHFRRGRRRL